MNFLKENTTKNRLKLQINAYQSTNSLRVIGSLLALDVFLLPKVNLEDLNIETLNIPKSLRLGNQLEYFFEFLLESNENYQVVAKNIQIVKDKITIGELDFIIKNLETEQLIHIETASKFYLYDENLKEWIGPNRNDTLLKKVVKLKEKQFPFLYKNETLKTLHKLEISTKKIVQNIHFKAQLFIPFQSELSFFEEAVHNNIEGVFYTYEEFLVLKDKAYEYFVPEKQDWLIEPKKGEVWFSFKTILQSIDFHFQNNKNPLIWIKKSETEFEKCFVVDWGI